MAIPSYADIATNNNNPTCDSATIGATSGDTALDATWTANTLNLKFMANGQQFASNTCTYGQNITIPSTEPTRTGYNFAGWQLRVSAPEPVQYTACSQITDQTTCNEYSDYGCEWDNYSNACEMNSYSAVDYAPSESWCSESMGTWNGDYCELTGTPQNPSACFGGREDRCTYFTHKDTCEYQGSKGGCGCVWNEQQQSCSNPDFTPKPIRQ